MSRSKTLLPMFNNGLLFSKDEKEYLEHLSILFQRLNNFGLTINLKKCTFGKNEIWFLGPCHNT